MITSKRLKECLDYDEITGIFTWKEKRRGLKIGDKAGSITDQGYTVIRIDSQIYRAHRLVWLWVYDEFPKIIDHIDGDRSNNALCNLRNVDRKDNQKNMGNNSKNTSGEMNIMWYAPLNKWHVQIQSSGKRIHIGYYHNMADAILARDLARVVYGFHPNHGKRKSHES